MTTITPTPSKEEVEKLVERVLELDAKATNAPWAYEQCGEKCNSLMVGQVAVIDDRNGRVVEFLQGAFESYDEDGNERTLDYTAVCSIETGTTEGTPADAALIAEYRTAAPLLARQVRALALQVKHLADDAAANVERIKEEIESREKAEAALAPMREALVASKRELWDGARHSWTLEDFKNWAVVQQIDAALSLPAATSSREMDKSS